MGEGSLISSKVGRLNLEDIDVKEADSELQLNHSAQINAIFEADFQQFTPQEVFNNNRSEQNNNSSSSNSKQIEKTLSYQSSDSQLSYFSVFDVVEQFSTSLKDIGAYLVLNLTIVACATFKYFKSVVNHYAPNSLKFDQQYESLEDIEIGDQNLNLPVDFENDVQCMNIDQIKLSQLTRGSNLNELGKIPFTSDDEDTTTDDATSDDLDPLSDIQKAALMVQNNQNLSELCNLNELSPTNFDANDLSMSFSSDFLPADDDKENDEVSGSISRIWEDIAASTDESQLVAGERTLTGTILRSDSRFDGISRSATFQPTHAKLDLKQFYTELKTDTQNFDSSQNSVSQEQNLSCQQMAQEISTELPTVDSNLNNLKLNFLTQNAPPLKLTVIKGPCTGYDCDVKPCDETSFSIGRYPDNYFILGDPEISGTHVRFQVQGNSWYVVDVGSSNGTILNGQLISMPDRSVSPPKQINLGDKLVLGSSTTIKIEEYSEPVLSVSGGNICLSRAEFSVNGHQIDWEQFVRKHGGLADFQKSHDVEEKRETEVIECKKLLLHGAYVTQQGRDHRDKGTLKEDFVECNFPLQDLESVGLAMLFDGHGGTKAAQQCRHSVPKLFVENMKKSGTESIAAFGLKDVFRDCFLEADDELGDEGSGCTATVLAVQVDNDNVVNMQMANVGDSSGIMLNLSRHQFRELTHDHKVVDEQESARLDRLDTMRTHGGSRILGLNLSRTLGDKFVKHATMGVIADPHVSDLIQFSSDESVLVVMASDGLWDVLSFDEVAQIAGDKCIDGYEIQNIVGQLVDKAVARGSRDDISVLALLIGQKLAPQPEDHTNVYNTHSLQS